MPKEISVRSNQGTIFKFNEYAINNLLLTFKNMFEDVEDIGDTIFDIDFDDEEVGTVYKYCLFYEECEKNQLNIDERITVNSPKIYDNNNRFVNLLTPQLIYRLHCDDKKNICTYLNFEQMKILFRKAFGRWCSGNVSAEMIREVTGEPDDLTEEEKERIRKQNAFLNIKS